jgi:hypothetical protein
MAWTSCRQRTVCAYLCVHVRVEKGSQQAAAS